MDNIKKKAQFVAFLMRSAVLLGVYEVFVRPKQQAKTVRA